MYRGHEVTRTGSLTVLQRPAQDIVANPLSMFSRPRQANTNSAPDARRDFPDMDPYQAQAMLDADENDTKAAEQEKESSPLPRTDSPVSIEEMKPEGVESLPFIEDHQSNQSYVVKSVDLGNERSNATEQPTPQVIGVPSIERPVVSQSGTETTSKKSSKKRFSFHSGFLDKKDKDPALLTKKNRRRTVSFTKSTEDPPNASIEALQPSPESSGDEILAHPAVRPLSPTSTRTRSTSNTTSISSFSTESINANPHRPAANKGKYPLTPLVVPKGPVYGRCACCGKIKRPHGFSAELSPVLENENIRTNFSLEMDRSRTNLSIGSNEIPKPRGYTPIIPMEVPDESREGSIRTVQASIEPALEVHEPKPRNNRDSNMPKIVRFASLHKLNGEEEEEKADDEEIEVTSTPVVDPTIKPKYNTQVRPIAALVKGESFDSMSTASIAIGRPVSMTTVKPPADVAASNRPMSYSAVTAPSEGRPMSYSATTAPSEGSGRPLSVASRSSVIDQWYENAIREGPKQDVITVVGWDDKNKKVESRPDANGHTVAPAKASSVKETSPYEAQTAMNGHAVSPTASPSKDKENKRKSLLSGGFFKKLVTSSKSEDAKTPIDPSPVSALEPPPQFSRLKSNDSEISMSGANGFITAPTSQVNTRPSTSSTHHQTTTTPPPELNMTPVETNEPSKSQQHPPATNKKGHAYKLSLGLGDDDMSLGLPTPHLGPHFARSNATLRDLVLAQRTPDSELDYEDAMEVGQQGVADVRA